MTEYAALSKTPHALADGLMLVFQHPVRDDFLKSSKFKARKSRVARRTDRTPQ
jgi:hypothetical protein